MKTGWTYAILGACCGAGVLAWWFGFRQSQQTAPGAELTQLTARCESAMIRDVCTVMKGSAPNVSAGRLFIAGIGEVDAQAYASLRAAGAQMCGELAGQCKKDWLGQACKIGKALYADSARKL